jgi:hypothetical protein
MRSARFRERRHQQIPYSMAIRAGTVDEKLINDNLQGLHWPTPASFHGVMDPTALRVWRKMPSNRCGHDATVTLGQYRCVCASCRGQDHDSCVREATSTHEQFAHVWCMTHIVRLAFCDRPPYAVFDGEYRGAWLSVVTGIIQARNMTVEYVQGALTKCDEVPRQTLIGMLQNGVADIALYPFVFNRRQTLQRASCQRTL